MKESLCPFCREVMDMKGRIGFRDTCGNCGKDLHVCRACRFYDTGSYNECREPQAERVLDKERANFCEYFVSLSEGEKAPFKAGGKVGDPRSRLEELFKK